jgi:hypothetical protein
MKKIFFTYSDNSRDVELYTEFNKHFKTYAQKGLVMIVDKQELFRVDNDKDKVAGFLQESDIAIPLLSVDYLGNDDCMKLLGMATAGNKMIIPVLLRDCDWADLDKRVAANLLPDDKQSVIQHIKEDGSQDEVFSDIAKKVKAIMFKELESVTIKTGSNTFYYILSGIVLVIGILAAWFSYSKWLDWKISTIIFLMFGAISLLAIKNVLFPTKFKIG